MHHHPPDPNADLWGVRREGQYGTGAYDEAVSHPLANMQTEEIHAYAWPIPDAHDWENFKQQVQKISGRRAVACGGYEPYLLYCSMRGMEQAMMDLMDDEEIADAILGHIFDYHYRVNARMFEIGKGKIDLPTIAEDLGMQNDLLMSLDRIRRFILPNQKNMADLARSFGIHIFYHTDGAARKVIPDLIDVTGIEVLNPIQWRCPGMEREGLVRDFGARSSLPRRRGQPADPGLRYTGRRASGSAGQPAHLRLAGPLDLRAVPQPAGRVADRQHRGAVRDDPRVRCSLTRLQAAILMMASDGVEAVPP